MAIEKLKAEQIKQNQQGESLQNGTNQETENLTETDKFSREFLATVSALNQNGTMDQATVDKLSSSLADKIKNSVPRKVFSVSDIKIIKDDSIQTIKNYTDALVTLSKGYNINDNSEKISNILQEFMADENNPNVGALSQLDPTIEQINKIITGMVKMSVPQSISDLHLDLINALERVSENLTDMKLYDTDVIVALSAVSQYDDNNTKLESASLKLSTVIYGRN